MTQDEALHLLRQATSAKVARGAELKSLDAILRSVEEQGDQVLAQLARYRRAHLALRRGDLDTADALFARVSRSRCLGPWPSLYGLAVALRRSGGSGARRQAAIEALSRPSQESSQSAAANALEALLIGTGQDLSELESIAGAAPLPGLDPDRDHPAHRFMTRPEGTDQRVIGELGEALVAEAAPDRLRLVLTEHGGTVLLPDGGRRTFGLNTTRLLAARLREGGTDRECLRRGMGLRGGPFRQALVRARREVPEALDSETGLNRPTTACVAEVLWPA